MVNKKIILIPIVIVLIDQITKYFVRTGLDSVALIQNVFHLTFVKNTGAGFGILPGQTPILIIISLIVLGAIAYHHKKIQSQDVIPFALITGGLIGNLIDRALLGYVVDFIDFQVWPVFNIADACLTVGVVWLVVTMIVESRKEFVKKSRK